jgi:PTH1 family peptidyl-tRNA hydrolase
VPKLGKLDTGGGPVLVVGLGNPGRRYRSTRHNAGRVAADRIIGRSQVLAQGKWPAGRLWLLSAGGRRFLVLEPETFMNLSGQAVEPVLKTYGLKPEQVLAIHDDIDLALGDVRLKKAGGTGGHRGLNSLADRLGGAGFSRVRIGVGRPPEGIDAAEYVLDPFGSEEREAVERSIDEAAEAALTAVREAGVET